MWFNIVMNVITRTIAIYGTGIYIGMHYGILAGIVAWSLIYTFIPRTKLTD